MADNASRRGAADLGTPLMIVAFLLIGGFLWWLNGQADAERATRVVEEAPVDEGAALGATNVAAVDIQLDASPYVGQMIRLASLPVASNLGTQGFWLEMPNGNPFLVSMSPGVMAEGLSIGMGQNATVIGVVHAIGDSVLTAWTTAGTIAEGDRLAAEFATHYLEAERVQVAAAAPSGNEGQEGNEGS